MEYRQHREVPSDKPTRYYSSKQEKRIAKANGGKQTKNSGATPWQKGDVTTEKWLMEAKTCVKDQKSFTLHKAWFEKNKQESLFMHKPYSAVVFNFGPNDNQNYYVVDEQTFLLMKEALENMEET